MNVLVHAHIPQKLQNISDHFDMRYAILWHTLKYMFIATVLLFTYSRAVQYGYNESAGMYLQSFCGHCPLPQPNFRLLNFPTITEMVVDQLEEAGYTNLSRQYFSVSTLVFSLASLQ